MKRVRLRYAKDALHRQHDRLANHGLFRVSVILLPFFACLILSVYVSLECNPRLKSVAKPMELVRDEMSDREVWLSLAPVEQDLVVTTADGRVFRWPLQGAEGPAYEEFRKYIIERGETLIREASVKGRMDKDSSMAVLSVDQTLNYHHVRPIIYALAAGKFNRYGFETRIIH